MWENFTFGPKAHLLDDWISRLLYCRQDDNFLLYVHEVESLCKAAIKVLKKEPLLLRLNATNYHVVGDLHGQHQDLQTILETHGLPSTTGTKYIFLGDYVSFCISTAPLLWMALNRI